MIDSQPGQLQDSAVENMERKYSYTVILEPEGDPEFAGYYNARVPALPGCFSYGTTKEESLSNIREAIVCYLEDMEAHGEVLPPDVPACLERVKVAL